MANARDVMRELARQAHGIARQVDEAPTGVVPGYNAALGGTVLPNGKVRYANVHGTGLLALAYNPGNATDIPSSATGRTIVQYSTVDHDPLSTITTGSSWAFTAPFDETYEFHVSVILRNNSTTDGSHAWSTGDTAHFWLQRNNSTLDINLRLLDTYEFMAAPAGNHLVPLQGSAIFTLSAGDYVQAKARQVSTGGWHRGVDSGAVGTWFYANVIGRVRA